MSTIGILVCSPSNARLFELRDGDPSLHLQSVSFHRPASPRRAPSLPSAASAADEKFARLATDLVQQAVRFNHFDEWVLIAPPFLVKAILPLLPAGMRARLLAAKPSAGHSLDSRAIAALLRGIVPQASLEPRATATTRKPGMLRLLFGSKAD